MILKPRPFRKPRKGHWATKNLASLWPFYEGSGNIVRDLSDYRNTGTFGTGAASPSWVTGKFGGAIATLEGDYINCGNDDSLNIRTGSMSWSFWVKFTSGGAGEQYIITKADATYKNHIQLRLGKIRYVVDNGPNLDYLYLNETDLRDDTWHHVVVVHNEVEAKAYGYIDGVLGISPPTITATGDKNNTGVFYISSSSLSIIGSIDAVSVYRCALTASEIALLYSKPFCMFERDPIELWSAATLGAAPPVGMAGAMTTNTGYWGW